MTLSIKNSFRLLGFRLLGKYNSTIQCLIPKRLTAYVLNLYSDYFKITAFTTLRPMAEFIACIISLRIINSSFRTIDDFR